MDMKMMSGMEIVGSRKVVQTKAAVGMMMRMMMVVFDGDEMVHAD